MDPLSQAFVESLEGALAASKPVTDNDVANVAAEFAVHPRTVVRCLAGLDVRGQAGVRARTAVAKLRSKAS